MGAGRMLGRGWDHMMFRELRASGLIGRLARILGLMCNYRRGESQCQEQGDDQV